ncbi:translation initiation factor IF-2 subunit gamma [archaeon]|nr:translation initiation factor IF-2 subunit gamma [archaeon]
MTNDQSPGISIGLVGHVDTGKTTLCEALSGKWTDTHSEELKRGITIRLGYVDVGVYQDNKTKKYTTKKPKDEKTVTFKRNISFIDAPGHETLMATMLSGAAIMDAALLLVAANETCPQPQTREHLMALEIIGIKNIIIVQNKIDLVSEKDAKKNYKEIQKFVKDTLAEKAPIIPISAQHNVNIDALIEAIETTVKTPTRDTKRNPSFLVARSFDVNKPGTTISKLQGGVLGGSLRAGTFKINDEIEIRPGLKKDGPKPVWEPVITKIVGLKASNKEVKAITPGGSSAILTDLDPVFVKSDTLVGNLAGLKGKVPEVYYELVLKPTLLERVVGVKDDLLVENIKEKEMLMLNVNAAATVGNVTSTKKGLITIQLKLPVAMDKGERVTISRQVGARWRLIGYGVMA